MQARLFFRHLLAGWLNPVAARRASWALVRAAAPVATAHRTHGANVALSWAALIGLAFVVLSGNPAHLADDLRLFDTPPWGRLTEEEMASLSELRVPRGRPSHWGDCRDAPLS